MPLTTYFKLKDPLKKQVPFENLQQSLLQLDEVYPHISGEPEYIFDETDMDNIEGANEKDFKRRMQKFIRKMNSKLPSETKVASEKARVDLAFLSRKKGEKIKYYPFVIDFEDGQYLIGLARQYGDERATQVMNRNERLKVTRWLLNGVDIDKELYANKKVLENEGLLAETLAKIVEKNHNEWVRKNPGASVNSDEEIDNAIAEVKKEIEDIQKQIDAIKHEQEASGGNKIKENEPTEQEAEITAENIADKIRSKKNIKKEDIIDYVEKIGSTKRVEKDLYFKKVANTIENEKDKQRFEAMAEWTLFLREREGQLGKEIDEFDLSDNSEYTLERTFLFANNDYEKLATINLSKPLIIEQSFFGVKDKLEPIDKYIAKIKASKEYQEFVSEKEPRKSDGLNIEELEKLVNSLDGYSLKVDEDGSIKINDVAIFKDDNVVARGDKIVIEKPEYVGGERVINPEKVEDYSKQLNELLRETDYKTLDKKLDEVTEKMSDEELEQNDELLNEVADHLTKLMEEAN